MNKLICSVKFTFFSFYCISFFQGTKHKTVDTDVFFRSDTDVLQCFHLFTITHYTVSVDFPSKTLFCLLQ